MRKSIKRTMITALLACLLVLSAACSPSSSSPAAPASAAATTGGSAATQAAATTAAPAEPVTADPVKVSWINRLPATFVVENNPVVEELGKRTNTIIEVEAPPINNYDDRRNIVMASGDIHDIVYGGTGQLYEQWATDGLILQLDEHISKMPNVQADLTDLEWSQARIPSLGGGIYSIPRVQTKAADAIGYRGDWLETLGMEVPTTPAEFAAVAYAMSHNDPDGNGKDDTYGFSFQIETLAHRYTSSCFFSPATIPNDDGSYSNIEAKPGYMEYMDWLRGMYEDGSMDPEWYLNTRYGESEKFTAGKVGTRALDTTTSHTMDMYTNSDILAAFPTYKHVPGAPLRAEGASVSDDYWSPPVWGNWYISATTKNLDAVLGLIDYGFSDEGHILLMYGIEGIHYNSIDLDLMYVDRTDAQKKLAEEAASSYLTFRHRSPGNKTWASGQTMEQVEEFVRRESEIRAQTNLIDYIPSWESVCPGVNAANLATADLDTERNTMVTKYICCEITRDEFVKFLDEKYNPAKQPLIDAITAGQPNK